MSSIQLPEPEIEKSFQRARLNRLDRSNVVPRNSDMARLRTCKMKVGYATAALADKTAEFMHNKHKFNFHKYLCPYCREYHIAKTWGKVE